MSKPLSPPLIYHDGVSIYLEFSTHALRLPFTEGGLHKALKLIPHIASTPGYVSGGSNLATKLLGTQAVKVARKTASKRELAKATDAQKQSALEIVRRIRAKATTQ